MLRDYQFYYEAIYAKCLANGMSEIEARHAALAAQREQQQLKEKQLEEARARRMNGGYLPPVEKKETP